MRRALPLLSLGLALAVAGCRDEPEREPALAPVRLAVTVPADAAQVDADEVTVSGTVSPAGTPVLVAGEQAAVSGGTFSAEVDLDPGANVVDVVAGAPRRPAAMTAVRITRLVPVEVPDVDDRDPEEARAALEALGLEVEFSRGGGLFDGLLPGDPGVCGTEPGAGERVRPGSTVTVVVANAC